MGDGPALIRPASVGLGGQAPRTILDFLERLPRLALIEMEIDETMFERLVNGDKDAWNDVFAVLADVDACGLYPPTAPSCQRWLRTLATAVAALASIGGIELPNEVFEDVEKFIENLGYFIITGDTRAFADCDAEVG